MRLLGGIAVSLALFASAVCADGPSPPQPSAPPPATSVCGSQLSHVVSRDGKTILDLKGCAEQGGLIIGKTIPGATLTLDGKPVMVSPAGEFILGFDREAPAKATLEVTAPGDAKTLSEPIDVAPRQWNIQAINGLPPEQVNPTPEELARIHEEAVRKAAARKPDTDGVWFTEKFIWPANGPISGVFGSQRVLNGEPRAPHYGVDMAVPDGTPVHAPAGGVVRLAVTGFYFEGGLVFIDHGHGLISYMMHMSDVKVHEGQTVKQGDVIGASGHAGRATGPHVHWGMFWLNAHIDPQLLVPHAEGTPPAPVVEQGAAATTSER